MIHPTAIIHPKAKLDSTVSVGPYAIIDEDVELGPHCVVGPHVQLTGLTTIGSHNQFYAGCVIGEVPQDLKYKGEPTRLRIGDRNIIREHNTIHRSNKITEDTVVGSDCFIMGNCHVGHNCNLGNHVILANAAMLGGHVTISDRVFLSAGCLVHQFCRIGTLSLMQGGSKISQDVPPYTVARGGNRICGLNTIGLRRAGITPAERLELKGLYLLLFRSGKKRKDALEEGWREFKSAPAGILLDFVASTKRGVCPDYTARSGTEPEAVDE